jgi:hypothetical protein
MAKEQVIHAYKIESAQVMRFHGDFARTAQRILKTPLHYVQGIIATDVYLSDWQDARDKLALHGIFVKEMVQE